VFAPFSRTLATKKKGRLQPGSGPGKEKEKGGRNQRSFAGEKKEKKKKRRPDLLGAAGRKK